MADFLASNNSSGLRAVLIFVAYHPGSQEVRRLQACLCTLPDWIQYVVIANDYRSGEAIDQLKTNALLFHGNRENLGYGKAVNQAVHFLRRRDLLPSFIAALNTDISWSQGTFARLLDWLENHPDVVLAVPRLISISGVMQYLCKRDPTFLSLFSRRFVSQRLKFSALERYDRWYTMSEYNYESIFEVEYLSGCAMLIRTSAFLEVGGFDPQFFLYLEDADITRSLRKVGRTIHLPLETVVHYWGRGSHTDLRLTLVNIHSAWKYFLKWGFRLY